MFFLSKFKKCFLLIFAALLIAFSFNFNQEVKAINSAAATTNQTTSQLGSVMRECWLGIGGNSVSGIPLNSPPSSTDVLTSLETPSNWADNYGTRVRGYLTAPQTGGYTFWIAGDDESQLWLSTTNQPSNKVRIASVSEWTNSREWSKYASQKSVIVNLTAGQSYYFEVLQKDGDGGDNLAVGWSKPGQSSGAPSEIVPGSVLSQFANLRNEQAKSADAFVDSIGINVHFGYTEGVYGNFNNVIKPRLQELGVRHIRDGLEPTRPDMAAKFRDIYNSSGIKTLLIMNPNHTAAVARDYVKNTLGAEKVAGIEGINEPNNFIGGCCWAATTRNFQQQMFQTFRSDAATASLPFIAPSLVILDAEATAARELGDLSAFTDYGNIHNYYGARNPETNGWGGNGYGSLDFHLNVSAPPVSGNRPVWSTETGYHNASTTSSGHIYTPESIVARYMPRLFLQQFNRGVIRSYPYELIDQGTNTSDEEQNFGLLHVDNTPKPSFTAMKNLISLLKDPGASFAPGTLDYALGGEMANVNHTLLQKRDGSFYLVLWIGGERWNPGGRFETQIPNQTVTLSLNSRFAAAKTYLPLNGANVVNTYQNPTQVSLSVPDHPLVVELKPSSGPTAAGGVISGRISNSGGRGIINVRLTLTGGSLTEPIYATSTSFGYYQFPQVPTGESYIVTVNAKRYRFNPSSKFINLLDSLDNVDFVGEGRLIQNLQHLGEEF